MPLTNINLLSRELGIESTKITELCQSKGWNINDNTSWIEAEQANLIRRYFKPIEKYVLELPKYLDKKIFNELGGNYKRNPNKAKSNVNNDDEEIKRYLGTYFPRTYIEILNIFLELFRNDIISGAFEDRDELNILDIGSGPGGGSFLGIIECIARRSLLKCKKIIIYSIDGNQKALKSQEELLNAFRLENKNLSVELNTKFKEFSSRGKDFKTELEQILKDFDQTYDIIIASKFLSELYCEDENTENIYYHFACIASKFLSRKGLLLISDVTIPRQQEYTLEFPLEDSIPTIMKRELHKFVKESSQMSYVLPLSCSRWHRRCVRYNQCFTQREFNISHSEIRKQMEMEKSRITYNVFAREKVAQKVLSNNEKGRYFCNAKRPDEACCNGLLTRNNKNPSGELDGFILQ